MIDRLTAFATVALLAAAAPASAKNELVLLSDADLFNVATLAVEGTGNRLQILQEFSGSGAANTISVSIDGNGNGGPLGASFSGTALLPGLQPGSIFQSGFGNRIGVSVLGSDNLFAFSQAGSGNIVSANITGFRNEASVLQEGTGNQAHFSQNGIGNVVSIIQRSW